MNNFTFLLEGSANPAGSVVSILFIVLMFVAMWFFLIRPQRKQEKKDAAMRDALQVGDEVTTIGGIIGKIVSIKEETFVLETTKNKTKIRFLKGAVRTVDVKVADLAAATIQEKAEAKENEQLSEEKPAEAPSEQSEKNDK